MALLAEMLRGYGATPELFLPLRMEEGYGLSRESVERCLEQYRPQLLIAIDCGTASASEIAELKNRGVDVIVLDHHEPKSQLPDCVAIVNPKADSASSFHYLCSVGIVFKLCHALLKTRPLTEFDLKSNSILSRSAPWPTSCLLWRRIAYWCSAARSKSAALRASVSGS